MLLYVYKGRRGKQSGRRRGIELAVPGADTRSREGTGSIVPTALAPHEWEVEEVELYIK